MTQYQLLSNYQNSHKRKKMKVRKKGKEIKEKWKSFGRERLFELMWGTSVVCRSSQRCCWRKRREKAVSAFVQGQWWPPLTGELVPWLWPILGMLVDSFNIFYIFLIGIFILVLDFLFFFSMRAPPHPPRFVKVDICHCPPCHTHCTDAHFPFSYHFVIMLGVSSMFVFYYDHSVNAVHSGPCCYLRLLSYTILFSL